MNLKQAEHVSFIEEKVVNLALVCCLLQTTESAQPASSFDTLYDTSNEKYNNYCSYYFIPL